MVQVFKRWCRSSEVGWSKISKPRRHVSALGRVEMLESRRLLSAWDTNWEYGPPPGAEPPGTSPPYDMHIDDDGLSTVEVPGEGNAPILKPKIKGDSLKGKVKSGDIKGKINLQGNFADNQTPNDGDKFSGNITFKIRLPGGGTVTINMNVTGAHAASPP